MLKIPLFRSSRDGPRGSSEGPRRPPRGPRQVPGTTGETFGGLQGGPRIPGGARRVARTPRRCPQGAPKDPKRHPRRGRGTHETPKTRAPTRARSYSRFALRGPRSSSSSSSSSSPLEGRRRESAKLFALRASRSAKREVGSPCGGGQEARVGGPRGCLGRPGPPRSQNRAATDRVVRSLGISRSPPGRSPRRFGTPKPGAGAPGWSLLSAIDPGRLTCMALCPSPPQIPATPKKIAAGGSAASSASGGRLPAPEA